MHFKIIDNINIFREHYTRKIKMILLNKFIIKTIWHDISVLFPNFYGIVKDVKNLGNTSKKDHLLMNRERDISHLTNGKYQSLGTVEKTGMKSAHKPYGNID